MKDAIGLRMKDYYEDRTRSYLPRRAYTIIRIDGKAFHTYTRGLKEPFDDELMGDMDLTACALCKGIQGSKLAFVQSDEISLLLTDFDDISTDAWFDGNVQKIVSVSASLATSSFNGLRLNRYLKTIGEEMKWANFDSRVFTIPSKGEVENYFIWRQQDTTRNSISAVAQSLYSHKELNGKDTNEMKEMCFQKGVNWNEFAPRYKRGRIILKETYEKEPDETENVLVKNAIRTRWVAKEVPIFLQDREYLQNLIPDNE